MLAMIIIGLTGSIGMGKSTVADIFRLQQIPVYDADETVHKLYKNEAIVPLQKLFPKSIINGVVDRKILSRMVLHNPHQMEQLEKLIHPMIGEKEKEFMQQAINNNASLVVLDIPLLFETGADKRVDVIVVVTASFQEQRRRVLSRKNMNEEKFSVFLKRQMPDSEKRLKADFTINTQLGIKNIRAQVQKIIKQLQSSNPLKPQTSIKNSNQCVK